ncbi:MAG: SIMPL domain-containing protein [Balneolaceae bacterium]|nr:SIMPL domain-containing protein [Balneolaceae bacterium]
MRYLLLFILSFCLVFSVAHAQSSENRAISVTATGEIELPADIIQFNINMNAEGDIPQEAYNYCIKNEKKYLSNCFSNMM